MLLRELVGGVPPHVCKLILIDDPTGFGHRVTDGAGVLEHVLTQATEFEQAVAQKMGDGFVETERSLTRRVFATADRFWIVWLDGDAPVTQSGGIRSDWWASSGQSKVKEFPDRDRGGGLPNDASDCPAARARVSCQADVFSKRKGNVMRAALGCMLVIAGCGTIVADDKKEEKIDPAKLVGKWEPKPAPKVGVVIEYTKDGKILFSITADGKEQKTEGSYKLEGNKLTQKIKIDDKEMTLVRTIMKLTDTELVVTDEKGKERTLARIKGK